MGGRTLGVSLHQTENINYFLNDIYANLDNIFDFANYSFPNRRRKASRAEVIPFWAAREYQYWGLEKSLLVTS